MSAQKPSAPRTSASAPKPTVKPVRIAILGTGGMANRHVELYKQIPGVEVVAGCDVDPVRVASFAEKHGIPASGIYTDFAKALWDDPKVYAETVKLYPLRRIGEPDEIAGAAVFLAGPSGSFMTGQTIIIDGGGTVGRGG